MRVEALLRFDEDKLDMLMAVPFGAVRLALRPSCRTQLPRIDEDKPPSPACACRPNALIASPRAYPSARRSNVLQLPVAEVMPAVAKLMLTSGRRTRLTPATSASGHSSICSARSAAWLAASAAEQAVSYDTHGPCKPSTKDMRPAAIDRLLPVAAYTLRLIGEAFTMSYQSAAAMPRKTPVLPPIRAPRSRPAASSAAYPCSRSSRC